MGRAQGGVHGSADMAAFAAVLRPGGRRGAQTGAPTAAAEPPVHAGETDEPDAFAQTFGADRGKSPQEKLQDALASGDDDMLIAAANAAQPEFLAAVANAVRFRSKNDKLDFLELRALVQAASRQPLPQAQVLWDELEEALLHGAQPMNTLRRVKYERYNSTGQGTLLVEALQHTDTMPQLAGALVRQQVFDADFAALWVKTDPDVTEPAQQELLAAFRALLDKDHSSRFVRLLDGKAHRPGGAMELCRDRVAQDLRDGYRNTRIAVWQELNINADYKNCLDDELVQALNDGPAVALRDDYDAPVLARQVLANSPISVCAAQDLAATLNAWVTRNQGAAFNHAKNIMEDGHSSALLADLTKHHARLEDPKWSEFADAVVNVEAHQYADVLRGWQSWRQDNTVLGGTERNNAEYEQLHEFATSTLQHELRASTSMNPSAAAAEKMLEPMVQSLAKLSKQSGPDAFKFLLSAEESSELLPHYQDRKFLPDRNVAHDLSEEEWATLYRNPFKTTYRGDKAQHLRFNVSRVRFSVDAFLAKKYDMPSFDSQKHERARRSRERANLAYRDRHL